MAREISLATQQQNAASDEVVLTLKEVSQVVQRMADGLKQFSDTADRLNQLGLIIQMLAQSFHLDSPHSLKHLAETWARRGPAPARQLGGDRAAARGPGRASSGTSSASTSSTAGRRRWPWWSTARLVGDREVPRRRSSAGEGFAERPWYKAAVRESRAIITPLFNSLLSSQPIFTAAAPVFEKGELAGVLGLDVNVDSWTKI